MHQACVLCNSYGTCLYDHLTDMTFESDKEWSLYRCSNRDCRLIWLEPMPVPDDTMQAYEEGYYTHDLETASLSSNVMVRIKIGRLGKLLGYEPYLIGFTKGRLLDVGCGNGRYLSEMRRLGWQVEGLDPDPLAVRLARDMFKLKVHETTLENSVLHDESYDVITLNHVIEHLHDPASCLSKCKELLRPGGHLIIRTPNADSLGHRVFRESWFPLEVPRHFYIFSAQSLRSLAEKVGFELRFTRTAPRDASAVFVKSWSIKDASIPRTRSQASASTIPVLGLGFLLFEFLVLTSNKSCGEELVLFLLK